MSAQSLTVCGCRCRSLLEPRMLCVLGDPVALQATVGLDWWWWGGMVHGGHSGSWGSLYPVR